MMNLRANNSKTDIPGKMNRKCVVLSMLTMVQIPVALCAVGIAIVYYYLKDRQLSKKRQKAGEA